MILHYLEQIFNILQSIKALLKDIKENLDA